MLDLETMGNTSNCAIISIGAVMFDPSRDGLGPEFYEVVNIESCVEAGLRLDASTVMWWMQQSDEARAQFNTTSALPLIEALGKFSQWFLANAGECVWGNGASFDNVILGNAYKAVGLRQPWKFWNDRCYRTLKGEFKDVPIARQGTYHSAIDDAKTQALHLIEIYKVMR
jgi:hypothetical protein